jgi:hypothetical protein
VVHRRTGGNPFFVQQVTQLAVLAGAAGSVPVLVPRRVGVDELVSQRLLLGDLAAHARPGRDVVDAYARLADYLVERVPAAGGLAGAGPAQ